MAFSNRVQLKAHLQAHRAPELARLPFTAHLLVASTAHREADDPRSIEILASRFTAARGDYYCLVIYYDASYSHREIGFIAHESLEYLNRHSTSSKWRVPLMLCQSETESRRPLRSASTSTSSSLYQRTSRGAKWRWPSRCA